MTTPPDLRDDDLDPAAVLMVAARAYDLPPGDVGAVLVRGRRRVQRRQRALAALSVLALVGTTLAGVELLDGEQETTVSSGTEVTRGDVGVEWRALTTAAGLGYGTDAGATAPLYALSTAPGQADLGSAPRPRVVWRSDDGVEWTAVATVGQDLFLSDLSARDGRVYAVGTAPATAAVPGRRPVSPPVVGWSDDGARTWQTSALPIDLEAIAVRTTRSAVLGTTVAVGAEGTVVAGVLDASLDVRAALPAGVTAPHGWAATADGVDILGPDRGPACPEGSSAPVEAKPVEPQTETGEVQPVWCDRGDGGMEPLVVSPQDARGVVASYTWADLGVEGDLLRAVRRQPVAFFAPAGGDRFERLELPELTGAVGPMLLDAHDGGFDLVVTRSEGPQRGPSSSVVTVLSSPDGRTWSAADAGADSLWALAVGRVGGVATIVAHRPSGPVVLQADGAGRWVTTSLLDAVDPAAREGKAVHLVSAGVGQFGIVAAVAVAPEREQRTPPAPAHRVLVSRDGRTWADADVDDLAGRPVRSVIRAGVVGERAVVAVSVAPRGAEPEQLVLVGTPE